MSELPVPLPGEQSNPLGRFAAVLFDVDGTLIDTADLIADSLDASCREYLGFSPPRDELLGLIGRPAIVQMQLLGAKGATAQRMMDYAIEYYEAHSERERAFPGALDLLARLCESGVRLGLVTSKTRWELNPTLERTPLQKWARVIITAELTSRPKPHPDPVFLALQMLQAPAEHVLFAGDSPYDIQSGRAAGVRTAAATWGPHSEQSLAAEQPDYLLHSFRDIVRICGID